jgi:hypothetical protein
MALALQHLTPERFALTPARQAGEAQADGAEYDGARDGNNLKLEYLETGVIARPYISAISQQATGTRWG